MFRWLTAGESHGPQLTILIEGLPSGLEISSTDLRHDLRRRQGGHGRGGRQQIEVDEARITAGVRGGYTIGSPVALVIENRDHANWTAEMTAEKEGFAPKPVTRLRPGHVDLAGALKYQHSDVRNVLERSSARETASRVAAGGVARRLLAHFGIRVFSFVQSVGPVDIGYEGVDVDRVTEAEIEASPVRCPDPEASARMVVAIDEAGERGDTLGGTFRVIATGLPIGLGSHVHWDRKIDGLLAQALMSIHSVKGVEIGGGFGVTRLTGSHVHDVILPRERWGDRPWERATNNAGGTEGGVTDGQDIVVRVGLKPIATLPRSLPSADLHTGEEIAAHYERSDVCVVPAAGVIVEAMCAIVLARAALEKFGGDHVSETLRNYQAFLATTGPRAIE